MPKKENRKLRLNRRKQGLLAGFFVLLLASFSTGAFFLVNFPTRAATVTWDGGGTDGTCGGGVGDGNKWSCGLNWSTNSVPTASDVATFNATSTKNATIDSAISVSGIDINTGYSGTITQAAGVTVTVSTGNFDISAGTFTGGNSKIDINGSFAVTGGSFTSTTGDLEINTNFTVSSGTFEPSTGTIVAVGGLSTYDVVTTETFNNFTINPSTNFKYIGSGDTIIVTGTLTLTESFTSGGTIDARGNISQAATYDGGTTIIDFGNNGVAQTYTIAGGEAPTIRFDSASDASDAIIVNAATLFNGITTTSGFSGTILLTNTYDDTLTFTNWTQAAGTIDASSQTEWRLGNVAITGGTFTPPALVTMYGGAYTWDVNVTETFENLTIAKSTDYWTTFSASDTIVVTGALTLTEGYTNSGTIDARSDITQAATYDGGSTTINFGDNGVAQTYTIDGGEVPNIRFDADADASDAVEINTAVTIYGITMTSGFTQTLPLSNDDIAGGYTLTISNWTQAAGSYDASAQTGWIMDEITISGGNFTPPPSILNIGGNSTWNVNVTETFNNVTVNKTSGYGLSITAGDTIVVTGTLTLTNGQVDIGIIDARGAINQAATFDGGTATIDFGDNGVAQTYTIDGGRVPNIRFDADADASDAVEINAAVTIYGVTITSGFTQTAPISNDDIGGGYALTVSNWTQAAGSYDASAQTGWIMDEITISGGNFTPPATVFASVDAYSTWNVNTTETFQNITVNRTNDAYGLTVSSGDTIVVTGTLTLTNGQVYVGTIDTRGDINQAATFDGGSATIDFGDNGVAQTYTIDGGAAPTIRFDSAADASDTVEINAAVTINGVTITSGFSGTIPISNDDIAGGYTLTIDNWIQAAGSYNASAQNGWTMHTITITGGDFTPPTTVTTSSAGCTWNVNTSETFNNLTMVKAGWTLVISTGDTIIVTGTLNLTDGAVSTGTLQAEGNVTVASTYDGGTSPLKFSGGNVQTFNLTGATGLYNADITVNKSGGAVNLASALVMDATGQDLLIQQGTMDLSGNNLTVTGAGTETIIVSNTGNLQLQGGETITGDSASYPQLNSGSTVTYDGSGSYTIKDYTYSNLATAGSGTYALAATETINNVTITSGTLSLNGNGLTVSTAFSNDGTLRLRGSESVSLTMDTNSGTVEFTGDGDAGADTYTVTSYSTAYNNLTITSADAATDIFQLGAALDLAAGFNNAAGTFNTAGYQMNVAGNWGNTGTFNAASNTVVLDGTSQAITGATTFYNLTKSVAAAATLTLQTATTQIVTGTLTLNGASSQLLSIRSSSNGNAAFINPQGTRVISYLDVKDNTNSNAAVMECWTGCFDSLGNTNWEFEEEQPPAVPYADVSIILSRMKDPTLTTIDVYFTATNALNAGTVITLTFEGDWADFTAPTGGSGLGTSPSFGTTATGFTATCGLGGCPVGAVTIIGATAKTPATPGSYSVVISNNQNDDRAYTAVAIIDEDTVVVHGYVKPYITFDIDIGTSATPGGNNSSSPYIVDLGTFAGDAMRGSGADSVPYIELDLATNALLGMTVTIADTDSTRTLRSGSDDLGSVLSNTALTGSANGYGLCIVNADGLTMSGSYDGDGSNDGCTATGAGDDVVTTPAGAGSPETFLSTTSTLTSEANPIIAVKGRSSYTNPAHVDYATSVRFIATATF